MNDEKSGGDGPMSCGLMNVSVMSGGRFAGAMEDVQTRWNASAGAWKVAHRQDL